MTAPAAVRIHQNSRSLSISTNAATEQEFLSAIAESMAEHLTGRDDATERFYAEMLPLIVNICCKMRGYKADVTEHRVITAGEWLPEDVLQAIPEAVDAVGAK